MYGVMRCGSGSAMKTRLIFSPWSVIGKTGSGEVNSTGLTPAESWFITQAPYVYQSGQQPRITIVAMKENGGERAYPTGPLLKDIVNAIFSKVITHVPQPPPPHPNSSSHPAFLHCHPHPLF